MIVEEGVAAAGEWVTLRHGEAATLGILRHGWGGTAAVRVWCLPERFTDGDVAHVWINITPKISAGVPYQSGDIEAHVLVNPPPP